MKFSIIFSLFSLSPKKSFIENGAYPLCKNCIYYRPSVLEFFTPYQFGKCTKYGKKEVVSGFITYEYADLCRNNKEQCGISGRDYVARPDLLTLINHKMQHFSENSSKSKYICEKINSIDMDNDKTLQKTEEKNEEQTEKEKDTENCSSEKGDCSTEFCNECYSDDCKKKSSKTVD